MSSETPSSPEPQLPQTSSSTNSQSVGSSDRYVLYVWPGEWNLPSLDAECLTAMCFLKYSQVEHTVVVVRNPILLFKNEYPQLEYKHRLYVGVDQIVNFIKKQKNIDTTLNDNNYANMFALLNLFRQKFIPAFNLLCWLDDDNTYTVIRKAYGNFIKFPLSIFKLRQLANRAENSIMSNFRYEYVKIDSIKQQIIIEAKDCLNVLSAKLGDNLFMFENRPSLLDAYLFGYLSVLSQAPFVNSPVKSYFLSCLNLEPLVKRIRRELFVVEKKESESKQIAKKQVSALFDWLSLSRLFGKNKSTKVDAPNGGKSDETKLKTDFEAHEEWQKRKTQMMVIGIGVVAMLTYAFAIGIIRIDVIKTDLQLVEKS